MRIEDTHSMRIATSDVEMGFNSEGAIPLPVGRRQTVSNPVGRFMDGPVVRVPTQMTIKGARQIAALKRVNHLLVSEGTRVVGLLSCEDLSLAPDTDPVWKWTRQSLSGVSPDTDAHVALAKMEHSRTSFLLVSAGVLVLGIVTEARLRQALLGNRKERARAA